MGLTLDGGGGNTLDGLQVGLSSGKQVPSAALHGIVVDSDDNIMTDCFVGGALAGDGLRITGSRNLFKLGFFGTKPGRSNAGMWAKNNTGIHLLGGSGNVVDFI